MEISDLPPELESEILSRVPAMSLSRLLPTCKRWYALFKDPRFVKKNSSKAATQVILKKDHRVYSGIIKIHNNFDPSIEFRGNKDSEHAKIEKISLCDGLLLCTTKDHNRIVVWNPCTGQTRWIQHSNGHRKAYSHNYYLGYENNNGNYKILSCSICYNDQLVFTVTEIYEFNSGSWRVLDDVTDWYQWRLLSDGGVSVKGNTYWFNKYSSKHHPLNSLLMFDFTTERLERLSLPFQSSYYDERVVLSAVRDEKLALLRRRIDLDSWKIWVAKIDEETKDLSWRDFSAVDFSKLDMRNPVGFLMDEENKMVVFCGNDTDYAGIDRIRIQIVGENMQKEVCKVIINESEYDIDDSPLLLSYVPSLVQIQEATTGD